MTNEETTLLHDYILFPQLTAVVQRSLNDLESAPNVFNRLFSASGTIILTRITNDLRESRLALNRAGLRVSRTAELNGLIHVEFTRKGVGRPEVYAVAREVLREEKRARMAQYIAEFGDVVLATERK